MDIRKEKIINILDILILIFLSIHVIGSQLNVVLSSFGLGGIIILASLRFIIKRNEPDNHDKNLKYFFWVLIFFYLLTSSISSDPKEAFFQNYRHIPLYAGFFVSVIYIKNLQQLKNILTVLFIFTGILSVYELVRYFIEYTAHNTSIELLRLGYFGYPITIGEIKMIILLLIIPLLLSKEKFILNKVWLFLLSIPIFLSLVFTNSRNAWIGLFSGLVVLGALKHRIFLIILIVVVILVLLFAPFAIRDRIYSIANPEYLSNKARIVMWETGFKMIKDHLVFGIGEVDIKKIYIQYKPNIEYYGEGSHMHNNFIQVLLMLGIPGFLAWLSLILYIFIRQIKIFIQTKKEPLLNTLALSSLICFIAFQVSGLTQWNFSEFIFAAVMWFSVSIAFISEKLYKSKTTK